MFSLTTFTASEFGSDDHFVLGNKTLKGKKKMNKIARLHVGLSHSLLV